MNSSNIYLVARWGNPIDGSDGPDTNFLVIAQDALAAAKLADDFLTLLDEHNGPNVSSVCNFVVQLGLSENTDSLVIHGPWIAHSILRVVETNKFPWPSWHRCYPENSWQTAEERFGKQ